MWRSSYSDEWERRKTYLIRSLFEDLPTLSPVPEAEECYGLSPSPVLRPFAARPCSPLPPLIIEPEPNRHDEPDSFYIQLEKKIKNYYRKLFIENRSGISSTFDGSDVGKTFDRDDVPTYNDTTSLDCTDTSDDNIEMENELNNETNPITDTTIIELEELSDFDSYSNKEGIDLIEEEDNIETANVMQTGNYQNVEAEEDIEPLQLNTNNSRIVSDLEPQYKEVARISETSSGPDYVQVTFKADVHKEGSESMIEKAPSLVYDVETGAWREVFRWDSHPDKKHQETRSIGTNEDSEENQDPDKINDNILDKDEIEAMRTPRNCPSVGSLENEPCNESKSGSISAEHKLRSLEIHTDSNTGEDYLVTSDINVESLDNFEILTSTPRCKENLIIRGNNQRSSNKRGVISASFSTPNKKKRNENVAVQTMCDETPLMRRILCDNFFIGTPKFFRLCSCKNHTCGC